MRTSSFTGTEQAAGSALEVRQRELEWRLTEVERELSRFQPKLERLKTQIRRDVLNDMLLGVYLLAGVGTVVLLIVTAVVRAGSG